MLCRCIFALAPLSYLPIEWSTLATDPNTRRVETTTSSSSLLLMLLAETIYHGYGETEAVMDVGNIMHALSELTNVLYLLALVILTLVLIG